jgi:hypothetical protein
MKPSSLLREPLVHFLVLGLLIFAVDRYMQPPADNRRTINVDATVEDKLFTLFKDGQGREPTKDEFEKLVKRWLLNEMYFREALALGLDRGDDMIRSRLVLKMRTVMVNNIALEPPTDKALREWFEAHRAHYDTPARYNIAQFFVADAKSDGRRQAESLIPASSAGAGDIPEAYANAVRTYANRTEGNIATLFGKRFASALLDLPVGEWGVIESGKGWHVARIESAQPAIPAAFEDVKLQVRTDYLEAQRTIAAFEAIKDMRSRYTILYEGTRLPELDGEVAE